MSNQSDKERRRRERAKQFRKAKSADLGVIGWVLVILAVILFIAACVVLGGFITLLAWNYGVVAIVAAAGGSVGKIGLLTAICANIAIGILGRIFRSPTQVTASS